MRCAASITCLLLAASAKAEDSPSHLIRAEQTSSRNRHITDKEHRQMFDAIDVNKDGIVSASDIRASAAKVGSHLPQDTLSMLEDLDSNGDGGISFAEFAAAAKHVTKKRHADVSQHRYEAVETTPSPAPADSTYISCGGHQAVTCEACPTTDADGQTVFDHGAEWCNGDCAYEGNVCKPSGSVTVDGVQTFGAEAKEGTPDILKKGITPEDKKIIDEAAQDAVKEEKEEKDAKEEEQEEGVAKAKGFDWGKFWMIIIVSFSCILGTCAIVSIVALITFCFMPKPEPPMTKEELLAEETEGEAGEEGEAAEVEG